MYLHHDDKYQLAMEEADPVLSERAKRRRIVNTFLARRRYWAVIDWLSAQGVERRFLYLDEAVRHFAGELNAVLIDPLEHGRLTLEELRARYVVARYFRAAGREWL